MQKLRPNIILERHVVHLFENAFQRQPHRKIARINDLVTPARIGEIDDFLGPIFRREG
jgi:hypothetical protein